MRKDPKISEYLDEYAAVKPEKAVLTAAAAELKANADRKKRRRVRLTAGLTAAAAFCVIVVVAVSLLAGRSRNNTATYFASSDVTGRAITRDEAQALTGGLFGQPADETYALFTFRADGGNAFVRARLRVRRAGGTDDVTVYVMLTDKTYRSLSRFDGMKDGDSRTTFENGEYCSDVYRESGDLRVMLLVESPNPGLDIYL